MVYWFGICKTFRFEKLFVWNYFRYWLISGFWCSRFTWCLCSFCDFSVSLFFGYPPLEFILLHTTDVKKFCLVVRFTGNLMLSVCFARTELWPVFYAFHNDKSDWKLTFFYMIYMLTCCKFLMILHYIFGPVRSQFGYEYKHWPRQQEG